MSSYAQATRALAYDPVGHAHRVRLSPRAEFLILWVFCFSSFFVLIEPAPFDILLFVVAPIFVLAGAFVTRSGLILILLLTTFNIGGLLALVPWASDGQAVRFVAASLQMFGIAVLMMMLISSRTLNRLAAIRSGLLWATVAASIFGILGFFDVAGLGDRLTYFGRASGTFKDANVLGPFAILGAAFAFQDILSGRGSTFRNSILLLVIAFGGIFLSFSRGAWGATAGTMVMLAALTYVSEPDLKIRRRVVACLVLGFVFASVFLMAALSLETISAMFTARASLEQDYDLGVTGRFGQQIRAIGMLIEHPNGLGPLQFRTHFDGDPHNVYVNAFAAYGWLGGFSYIGLVLATFVIGWKVVFTRFPGRPYAVAIWSVFLMQIIQGFQIDTDHWRHWFIMLGLIWGLFGLSQRTARYPAPARYPAGDTASAQRTELRLGPAAFGPGGRWTTGASAA